MTIHNEHPFLPPEPDRNPLRRLRGRLASPVCVLTATHGADRAGLTVSSVLVLDGEPGVVLAAIDPLSDLHDLLRGSGRAVLNLLGWPHRQLADAFGYQAPAPGGPFRLADWADTEWGPALAGAPAWAGCELSDQPIRAAGWAVLVELVIVRTTIGADVEPLVHHRGRYRRIG
ncbi:MAG TPA: flavin reductase family protein [Jatrophihabitans sp.]|nr:flavin reductase family protein [Jatrophihabitans sp.]